MAKTRYAIARLTHGGFEYLAVLESEDAAVKRLQRERELGRELVEAGWIEKPSELRIFPVYGRAW